MKTAKRSNQFLEIIRGILALLVVFSHFHVQGFIDLYIVAIVRTAVPFFLVVSGYYSYKNTTEESIKHVKKKLKSTALFILQVAIIYTVINTVVCAINGQPPFFWFTEKYLSYDALKNFLLFNRARFFSSIAYYLFMMVYVYAVYLLILKLKAVNVAVFFIPVLLIVNLVISEILKMEWFFVGNWMLTGLPFFLLGVLFKKTDFKLQRKWCLCLMGLGVISTLIEAYFIQYKDVFVYVGTIILCPSLFLFCKTYDGVEFPKILVNFGSNYSTYVFLYHCAVGYLLTAFFEKAGYAINSAMPFIIIAVTVFIIFVFRLFFRFLLNKKEKS